MLTFTTSGVVQSPTVLQVRLGPLDDGRLRAGAPTPARALTDVEVQDNLHHFTERRRGPRAAPCTAVVLSGWPAHRLDGLGSLLALARRWGVGHVTLHAGTSEPRPLPVDAVAVPVRTAHGASRLAGWGGPHRMAVVPLEPEVVHDLDAIVVALVLARPERVALTWPFPPAGPPALAHEVTAALDRVAPVLDGAGIPWTLKGLPACLAGAHAARAARSRNRWYVDAGHQRDDALLFFPDVVRFLKLDACRFCAADARCDGVAEGWLDEGRVPALRPLAHDPTGS